MSRTTIHRTTHLHRMAFTGEQLYEPHFSEDALGERKLSAGCLIASRLLNIAAEDPELQDYANTVISPGLLGSAWLDAFIDERKKIPNDLMYRIVDLPWLAINGRTDEAPDRAWQMGEMHVSAVANYQPIVSPQVISRRRLVTVERTREAYRSLALGSLWLGALKVARDIKRGWLVGAEPIQLHVRESGYDMVRSTLQLAKKIGVLPTISQLDQPYSPLTITIMQHGPKELRDSYQEVFEQRRAAA